MITISADIYAVNRKIGDKPTLDLNRTARAWMENFPYKYSIHIKLNANIYISQLFISFDSEDAVSLFVDHCPDNKTHRQAELLFGCVGNRNTEIIFL